MHKSRFLLVGLTTLLAWGSIGCDDHPKQIADLTAERDRLRTELDDCQKQLADCNDRERSASGNLAGLRNQLDDCLRGKMAQAPAQSMEQPMASGWTGVAPGVDMISVAGEVLFDSGKATLRASAGSTLDRIMSDIRSNYGDRDVYVFGHTDTDPIKKSGWKDNWELGAQRALTVTRYLASRGIAEGNLVAASCGEHRPKEAGNAAGAKQKNRRVEFFAVRKGGSRA